MAFALRTPRLLLRERRDSDAAPFAAMSADPALTEFLLPPDENWVARVRQRWAEHGFGLFVVELPGEAPFIGVVGLNDLHHLAPAAPAIEATWRLAPSFWGKGYALEAARAAIEDGFYRLGLDEIVAITVESNQRSRRVMERLGMIRASQDDFDFEHLRLPEGHPLRPHVLYRMRRPAA
ncbi:MAG: GNAT family N-acetyltransferase [Alphaproteobacteria bacterium]|nr:GNAT family N-acetyltransferase [Alphaproteobacteria bacterium]